MGAKEGNMSKSVDGGINNAGSGRFKQACLKFRRKYKNEISAYSMIGIPLIWWIIFFVIAFVWAFLASFTDMRGGYGWEFASSYTFDNYINIFKAGSMQAKAFWNAMKITVIWTLVMTVLNNVMGLLCAFLIKSLKKGGKVFLALLFWPSLVSAVVSADITKTLFANDTSGIVNQIIVACGGNTVAWLENPNTALFAMMFVSFFFGFCQKLLIYYSSIISIPDNYLEAASLETSSKTKVFFTITLPLMKNAIVLNTLLSIIEGFKILGPMQLIPSEGTESVMLLIYKTLFEAPSKVGQGCAYAFVLFVFIMIISFIQKKISGKEETSIE